MGIEAIAVAGTKKLAKDLVLPLLTKSLPSLIRRASDSVAGGIELQASDIVDRATITACFEELKSSPVTPAEFEKFLHLDVWERICSAAAASIALGGQGPTEEVAELISQELERQLPRLGSQQSEQIANELASALCRAAEVTWQATLSSGSISPVSATGQIAHRVFTDEIEAVRRQLAITEHYTAEQIKTFEQFASKYLRTIGKHYQKITPPSTADSVAVNIDRIYVPSDFVQESAKVASGKHEETSLTHHQLLSSSYRTVILGTPGAGKSTFLRKLCFDLWNKPQECPIGDRKLIPVLIVLRDYGRKKKDDGISILTYAHQSSRADLQLENVPDRFFEYLAASGRALFLFDGLDELLEVSDRVSVKEAVERFADNNPGVSIIVTARQVGYEQAPLSEDIFRAYRINSFSKDQVARYCENWFSLHGDRSAEEQKRTVKSFMRESESVSDIRSNPLLLALMCNLYKQDGYLPRNRPNVYSRCADLLFEKWDRHRGIKVTLSAEYLLRPAITNLAHWIYSDPKLREGVSEDDLIRKTASIISTHFDTQEEAALVAREFVDFCRGRAWVFTDTGSSKTESLYQFTHGTFLEFFTAQYLVATTRDLEELMQAILPKIKGRKWDIVCQLAIQIKASALRDGMDTSISLLLDSARSCTGTEKANVLSFVARSLEFLYPTPGLRRTISGDCLDYLFGVAQVRLGDPHGRAPADGVAAEILPALLSSAEENARTIRVEAEAIFRGALQGGSDEAIGAAFLLVSPYRASRSAADITQEAARRIDKLKESVGISCAAELNTAIRRQISLFAIAVWESIAPLDDLIHQYGMQALTVWCPYPLESVLRVPLVYAFFNQRPSSGGLPKSFGITPDKLLDALLSSPIPWPEPDPSLASFSEDWVARPSTFRLPKNPAALSVTVFLAILAIRAVKMHPRGSADYKRLTQLLHARDKGKLEEIRAISEELRLPEAVRRRLEEQITAASERRKSRERS